MKAFKRILVYVNPEGASHDALRVAERLAQASGATLRAIAVPPELPVYLREPAWGYPALSETLERETREKPEAILSASAPPSVCWTSAVRRGKPFAEIIREVLRGGHDLVIKTAERSGAGALFGDIAMRLFRKCPCPVWAVEPGAGDRLARVAAAVDPFDADQNVLNRRILDLSVEAARLGGGEAWAAHVFQPPPLSLSQQLADRADQMRRLVRKRFEALLEPYESTIAPDRRVLLDGEPETALRQFTQAERIDLLVMGTLVRTGVAGLFDRQYRRKSAAQCRMLRFGRQARWLRFADLKPASEPLGAFANFATLMRAKKQAPPLEGVGIEHDRAPAFFFR